MAHGASIRRAACLARAPAPRWERARDGLGRGDLEAARTAADRAVTVAVDRGQRGFEPLIRLVRGRVLLAGGDTAGAKEELERALETAHATGWLVAVPQIRAVLAEVAEAEGDDEARRRELEEARRLFLHTGAEARAAALPEPVG